MKSWELLIYIITLSSIFDMLDWDNEKLSKLNKYILFMPSFQSHHSFTLIQLH